MRLLFLGLPAPDERAVHRAPMCAGVKEQARAGSRASKLLIWGLGLLFFFAAAMTRPAEAVPAFATQTGQPCAACHVGAFGPQLKPYGRDFKLNGYVASDGQDHGPPLAITNLFSFTRTLASQPGGAAPGFAANNNLAMDQASLYYAGRITPWLGAFIQVTYDGVANRLHIDNTDIRRAGEGQLFGQDMIWGVTVNNNPTVQDAWNSTPIWGFPYNRSPLAPTPLAATLIDGGLSQRVLGAGAYMLWNNLLYTEFDAYGGLSPDALSATGIQPAAGPNVVGVAPYGRVAVIKDWEQSHIEVGGYGISAKIVPAGFVADSMSDRLTDVAADATYQYIITPEKVTSDMLSAHATVIQEWGATSASQTVLGALPSHALSTARADISYSFGATITPSIQIFRTIGARDATYWSTPSGSPNWSGMIFEVAYVPWGKPDSPIPGLNARLALQYVDYFRFNGVAAGATRNNNLYISLWLGVWI